jgi:hypothetical protein
MKRETLRNHMDYLRSVKESIDNTHLNEFFNTNTRPDFIYNVSRVGEIGKLKVTGFCIKYINGNLRILQPYQSSDSKPTRKLINDWTNFIDVIKSADWSVFVDYKNELYGSNGAYEYSEVVKNENLGFNEDDLMIKANSNKEIYGPREGYQPCAYCGKQIPINDLISKTIIGRGRKQVWNSWKQRNEDKAYVTEQKLKFCSGKCAGNEQMSREG